MVLSIRRQQEGGLAREVLEEQLVMGFPGLGQEVKEICGILGLPDAIRLEVQEEEVKDAIRLHSLMELKEDMAGKEKLKEMAQCDLRTPQKYVRWSVEEIRMAF